MLEEFQKYPSILLLVVHLKNILINVLLDMIFGHQDVNDVNDINNNFRILLAF